MPKKDDRPRFKDICVFVEIKDHETVHPGSLELLGKAREIADKLSQRVLAFTFGMDCGQYLDEIQCHGRPDTIFYYSTPGPDKTFKHYNEEIIVPLFKEFLQQHKPAIVLLAATEAGRDLAARIAAELDTGLTADCTDVTIEDHPAYGKNLLVMAKPAFGGNFVASIICPTRYPTMCTVRPGTFRRPSPATDHKAEMVQLTPPPLPKLLVSLLTDPTRYSVPGSKLEEADIIVAGGNGVGSQETFKLLEKLAFMLRAEVAATRVAVFNGWASEDKIIGQTGHIVHPKLYLAFGISGQIQHTTGMNESGIIVAINNDANAPIHEIADYSIITDIKTFLPNLIKELEKFVNLRFRKANFSEPK
nr:electron transfer flavoprotein subunit alpha/FixB family protein [Candidatus Sigynarchaeota archaeon]